MSNLVYANPTTLATMDPNPQCQNAWKKAILLLVFLTTLTIHLLSEFGYLWGDLSLLLFVVDSLITPPSFVFFIWGFMYTFYLAFMFYQLTSDKNLSNAQTFYAFNLRGRVNPSFSSVF